MGKVSITLVYFQDTNMLILGTFRLVPGHKSFNEPNKGTSCKNIFK